MTNTSREAVQDLIAELRKVKWTNGTYDMLAADTLVALLDERDGWKNDARALDLRSSNLGKRLRDAEAARDKLAAERDEAAQLSHEFRNERDKLTAKIDAVKAWAMTNEIAPIPLDWAALGAILADTDEGNNRCP